MWRIVPDTELDTVWVWVEPMLAKSLKRYGDNYEPQHFYEYIKQGHCQLWEIAGRSAAITQITAYPKKTWGTLLIGMGVLSDTESFIETMEAWAQAIGCAGIQSQVRKGFAGIFKRKKWRNSNILMEKEF